MNAVPWMEQPSIDELFAHGSNIPGFDRAKDIILAETTHNNKILLVGDIGFHPSETVVVIDFAEGPNNEYEGLKTNRYGRPFQYLSLSDNKGALQVNFGRIDEV